MPFGRPPDFHLGKLRYQVTLATRQETADPNGTGVIPAFINMTDVWADVTPVGLQVYIAGQQIEGPITHRITLRFIDSLDMFDVVLRTVVRPDATLRQEIYRIRRVTEWEGRERFTVADCELEQRSG